MNRRFLCSLLAAAACGMIATTSAEAGAPGAAGIKRTVQIRVFNDSEDGVFVVGFNEQQLERIGGVPTVQQARRNGGTYIAPGASKLIKVPAGRGLLAAWFADEFPGGGPLPEPETRFPYQLNAHARTTAGVDNVDDTLEITIPRGVHAMP